MGGNACGALVENKACEDISKKFGSQMNGYLKHFATIGGSPYKTGIKDKNEAMKKCYNESTDCNGVTLRHGNYTLRKGWNIENSPSGEKSYKLTVPRECVMSDWKYTNCKDGKRSRVRTIQTPGGSCDYPLEEIEDCFTENIVPSLKSKKEYADQGYKITSSTPTSHKNFHDWLAFRGLGITNFGWHTTGKNEVTSAEGKTFTGEWLQIELPKAEVLASFQIIPSRPSFTGPIKNYAVLGSNDGTNWTIINETIDAPDGITTTSVKEAEAFKFFRLAVDSSVDINLTSWTLMKGTKGTKGTKGAIEGFRNLNGIGFSNFYPKIL
jgi:hypothetical protein